MHNIPQRRQELEMSQSTVAGLCKVSRKCISDIENGYYLPTPTLAEALQTHLRIDGLATSSQVLSQREIQRLVHPHPFDLPPVNREPWLRMHRSYPKLLRAMRFEKVSLEWIERYLEAESATEGIHWCSIASQGAEGIWVNPHQLGYRKHAWLDSLGFALGERLLPALRWKEAEFESILWPQPRLLGPHGTFRPDGMLFVKNKNGAFWRGSELDGGSHRGDRTVWDREREKLIGLDFIRIASEKVLRLESPRILADAFRNLGSFSSKSAA